KIDLIDNIRCKLEQKGLFPNRLFWECLLWCANILEQEEENSHLLGEEERIQGLCQLFENNPGAFDLSDYHYYTETLNRFSIFKDFLENEFLDKDTIENPSINLQSSPGYLVLPPYRKRKLINYAEEYFN
ncbi:MAG: hypothetical protein ACOC1V_00330, partial [Candidatus Saliniplasma sp.]